MFLADAFPTSAANRYDETTAVAEFGDTLDEVRANGLISVCLGCGTTTSVPANTPESDRIATRDSIDWELFDCCPDADSVQY